MIHSGAFAGRSRNDQQRGALAPSMRQTVEHEISGLNQSGSLEELSAQHHEGLLAHPLEDQELQIAAFGKLDADGVIRWLVALFD